MAVQLASWVRACLFFFFLRVPAYLFHSRNIFPLSSRTSDCGWRGFLKKESRQTPLREQLIFEASKVFPQSSALSLKGFRPDIYSRDINKFSLFSFSVVFSVFLFLFLFRCSCFLSSFLVELVSLSCFTYSCLILSRFVGSRSVLSDFSLSLVIFCFSSSCLGLSFFFVF